MQTRVLRSLPLLLIPMADAALAGTVYTFRDDRGHVLFTNVVNQQQKPADGKFSGYQTLEKITYYKDSNIHRYRNWGNDEAALLPSFSKNRNAYDVLIKLIADREGVDRALVKAVMHTESGFNPDARSAPGAQGLMQLMPATADRFAVKRPFDPAQNIEGGIKYLRYLLTRFNQNTRLALAAYNAGEANVDKYNGIPPFQETQDYVRRVMARYEHLYKNRV